PSNVSPLLNTHQFIAHFGTELTELYSREIPADGHRIRSCAGVSVASIAGLVSIGVPVAPIYCVMIPTYFIIHWNGDAFTGIIRFPGRDERPLSQRGKSQQRKQQGSP